MAPHVICVCSVCKTDSIITDGIIQPGQLVGAKTRRLHQERDNQQIPGANTGIDSSEKQLGRSSERTPIGMPYFV